MNLLHEMAYHVQTCLGFKPNDQGHAHIYVILLDDNMPMDHRWYMGASWHGGKQCLQWEFTTSMNGPVSIFQVAEMIFM